MTTNRPPVDRAAGLLLIGNLGGAVCSVLLFALIGRVLGADGLGVYAAASAWLYPLSLLADFGVSSWLTRTLPADPASTPPAMAAAALHRMVFGGAIMVALIVCAPLLTDDSRLIEGLRIGAPLVVILPAFSAFSAVFRVRGAVDVLPVLNIGMIAVQLVLTACAFALGGGLQAAFILNTLTSAGQMVAAWVVYRQRFHIPSRLPRSPLMGVWRAAFHFALAGLFAGVQSRLALIALERLAGPVAVGQFTAASRFIDGARLIPNAYFAALFGALGGLAANPPALRRAFAQGGRRVTIYGVLVMIGVAVGGLPALVIVFGIEFAPAFPALVVLAVALAFGTLRGLATLYGYAEGREARVNGVNAGVIVILAGLCVVLVPRLGGLGAALALAAAELIGGLLLRYDARRYHTPVHSGTMTDPADCTASPIASPKKKRHSVSASSSDSNR